MEEKEINNWKEGILKAIEYLDTHNWDRQNNSTKYNFVYKGKFYPPKLIYRYAAEHLEEKFSDIHIPTLSGGEPTNSFLRQFGYTVEPKKGTDPVKSIIEKYKAQLRANELNDEIYKWRLLAEYNGRPDVNAVDFNEEIKSVKFYNLIYGIGIGAMNHMAREKTEAYRACYKILFDESIPLLERVSLFTEQTLIVYRELVPDIRLSHHHDERTIATLLTYHNPNKYTFFKNSFYQKYCKLIGIEAKKKGEKYVHYLELIDDLITEYINDDAELLDLIKKALPANVFQDSNHKILAQDILYCELDKALEEIDIENYNVFKVSMGDFTDVEIEQSIKDNKIIVHQETKAKGKSSELQGETFANMSIGDYFYLTHGNGDDKIKLFGRVSGPPMPAILNGYGDEGWLERNYELITTSLKKSPYKGTNRWWTPNNNSTCVQIKRDGLEEANKLIFTPYFKIKLISDNLEPEIENKTDNNTNKTIEMNYPLNQILYGPPGTGKTYNTINKAIAIANPTFDLNTSRNEIKIEFERLMNEGQIVFTTFHQSMCYEDFIEGIKPITDESGSVRYEVKPGIFKTICNTASTPNSLDFNVAYDQLKKELIEKERISLKTPTGKSFEISLNSNENLTLHTGINKNKQGVLTKENIQRQINGEKRFDGWEGYFKGVLDYLISQYNYSTNPENETKNFVLIIDEINRGNVSQIFGELITLIEEDKRHGCDEALETMLPYSKQNFSVPPNLYIIGTMNTADRSVEALDTALRRRFCFEEMPPKPELLTPSAVMYRLWIKYAALKWEDKKWEQIERDFLDFYGCKITDPKRYKQIEAEINNISATEIIKQIDTVIEYRGIYLSLLLTRINKRIEKLLDRDHQIGHSYFMSVYSLSDLKIAFQNKIIPLLQEYFFGDYGKIGLVLGKGFVSITGNSDENIFAAFDEPNGSEFLERNIYSIRNVTDMANEDFKNAIDILLK